MARLLRGQSFCPETFVLPAETKEFEIACRAEPDIAWILKPCQLGEGRHIEILTSKNVFERHQGRSCVASRYINQPLQVLGRKIDFRVYVLVAEIHPELRAFVFREGLVRFCSGNYEEAGYEKLQAHISNNAVQTKSSRHASGQNWTLQQLWSYLEEESCGVHPQTIWQRILRMVRDALTLWQPKALTYFKQAQVAWESIEHRYLICVIFLFVFSCKSQNFDIPFPLFSAARYNVSLLVAACW